MIEPSGAETGGNNAIFRLAKDLGEMSSTPGWDEIQNSAFKDQGFRTRIIRGAKLLRPVTSRAVERKLDGKGTRTREQQEAWITHTMAFAKNVLESEAITLKRAMTQGFDIADISPTGEHATHKAKAKKSGEKAKIAEKAAQGVMDARQALPVNMPDAIKLHPPDLAVFYGLAELYGMARAGFDPKHLPDYLFASDVRSVNVRSRHFLANHEGVLELLRQESPLERLESVGVSMPEAIEVADSPSKGTVMRVAQSVAVSHA